MSHSCMKSGEKRREEAAICDTGMVCCLVWERVRYAMWIGGYGDGLAEVHTLGDHHDTSVDGGSAL